MAGQTDSQFLTSAKQAHDAAAGMSRLPKDIKLADISAEMKKFEQSSANAKRLAAEQAQENVAKRRHRAALGEQVKNLRNVIKGIYGDDSQEYQLVGGKRRSTRKRPVRKPKEKVALKSEQKTDEKANDKATEKTDLKAA